MLVLKGESTMDNDIRRLLMERVPIRRVVDYDFKLNGLLQRIVFCDFLLDTRIKDIPGSERNVLMGEEDGIFCVIALSVDRHRRLLVRDQVSTFFEGRELDLEFLDFKSQRRHVSVRLNDPPFSTYVHSVHMKYKDRILDMLSMSDDDLISFMFKVVVSPEEELVRLMRLALVPHGSLDVYRVLQLDKISFESGDFLYSLSF